jgi:hypothetical protein
MPLNPRMGEENANINAFRKTKSLSALTVGYTVFVICQLTTPIGLVAVELQIEFTSRRPGTFGGSPIGLAMEWMTKTWLRFTCLLFSAIIIITVIGSDVPASEKLPLIILAPVLAIIYWYLFLFMLLICRYLGLLGRILAHVLVIYFFLFSRLIIQHPPKVWLPLISEKR